MMMGQVEFHNLHKLTHKRDIAKKREKLNQMIKIYHDILTYIYTKKCIYIKVYYTYISVQKISKFLTKNLVFNQKYQNEMKCQIFSFLLLHVRHFKTKTSNKMIVENKNAIRFNNKIITVRLFCPI